MLDEYPKEVTLQDGSSFILRPMTRYDDDALYRFFVKLADSDRKYLRNNTQSRVLIEKWCRELNYDKVLPILAQDNKGIIGNATLHRETHGWSKHIGEIRITISPEYQKRGLGSLMAQEIIELAEKADLERVMARVVTTREYVIKLFEQNGFFQVATLKNFIKSVHDNTFRDIAILVKDLKPLRA